MSQKIILKSFQVLACAHDNITLALACAWREIRGITSQHQEEMEKKVNEKKEDQQDILISSQVLVNANGK